MSLIAAITEAAEASAPSAVSPFIVAGIALVLFIVLGVVTFSYRDVANRHSDRVHPGDHDTHAGH
jgi:hypothetical protein